MLQFTEIITLDNNVVNGKKKWILLIVILFLFAFRGSAQTNETLQSVTDRGNSTSNHIIVHNAPISNINNGFRVNRGIDFYDRGLDPSLNLGLSSGQSYPSFSIKRYFGRDNLLTFVTYPIINGTIGEKEPLNIRRDNGHIGILNSNPLYPLDVNGRGVFRQGLYLPQTADFIFGDISGNYIGQYYGPDHKLHFFDGTGGEDLLTIDRLTGHVNLLQAPATISTPYDILTRNIATGEIGKLSSLDLLASSKIRENGFENLAIGKNALMQSDTIRAVENLALGENSLSENLTGSFNTAVGPWALKKVTSGNYNTALGNYVLTRLTSGSNNIGIGQNALNHIILGNDNLALGIGAGFNLGNGSNNRNIFIGHSSGANWQGSWNGSNNVIIGGWAPFAGATMNNTMVFATGNGGERFRINENGNFLIGGPGEHNTHKLQVDGSIGSFANEGREVNTYLPDSYTTGDIVSGHSYKWYNDTWRTGNIRSGNVATDGFGISLNNNIHFKMNPSGNIGIGTDATADRLSVNGTVKAKAIKVSPTAWPDYVFEKSYELKSLKETEQFIKQHKHLPEIPSAKDVEINGIDVGKMNAGLLKKIEELTLHLIEQQKQIEELRTLVTKNYKL